MIVHRTIKGVKAPLHEEFDLPSGSKIIRFNNLFSMLWYDDPSNNPYNSAFTAHRDSSYVKERLIFTEAKQDIYRKAKAELMVDRDLQQLIHKSKSDKRLIIKNKYGGSFSPVAYARGEEKIFNRGADGKKSSVINMAFQVGTFSGGNYQKGFTSILKAILAAQALGIKLNIDMFDSDTSAVPTARDKGKGYIICNVAKSTEKIDINKILVCSDSNFFNKSLFSGYAAQGCNINPNSELFDNNRNVYVDDNGIERYHIGTFLESSRITTDLAPFYEVIGGNMVKATSEDDKSKKEMVSQILKIAWK